MYRVYTEISEFESLRREDPLVTSKTIRISLV